MNSQRREGAGKAPPVPITGMPASIGESHKLAISIGPDPASEPALDAGENPADAQDD